MSFAEENIRKALSTFSDAFPGSKPCIIVRTFPDGIIQLFLHDPDTHSLKVTHAQGQGKTLDEASVALRHHLAVMVAKVRDGVAKEYERTTAQYQETFGRLTRASDEQDIPKLPL